MLVLVLKGDPIVLGLASSRPLYIRYNLQNKTAVDFSGMRYFIYCGWYEVFQVRIFVLTHPYFLYIENEKKCSLHYFLCLDLPILVVIFNSRVIPNKDWQRWQRLQRLHPHGSGELERCCVRTRDVIELK